jgi:RES domain-containing protein
MCTVPRITTEWFVATATTRLRCTGRLDVPSAVVPAERNVLLNPRHPAFSRILIGQAVPLETDSRLLRIS